MNRYELEVYAHRTYGRTIGWMANVINTSMTNPTAKIKGLLYLAHHDAVSDMTFAMDRILIDGHSVPWIELEKYADRYSEDPEQMRMHISQVFSKTVYSLAEAKMHLDRYHQNIQVAAMALLEYREKGTAFPTYGEYVYLGTNASDTTLWRSPEGSTITYNPTTKKLG